MLRLRSIWRAADAKKVSDCAGSARSFGAEVPQDDATLKVEFEIKVAGRKPVNHQGHEGARRKIQD